jgi:WD40 repeat protein
MRKTRDRLQEKQWQRADEEVRKNPSPGLKLVHTLRGHASVIGRIARSPDERMLASPSEDNTTKLWDAETGECLSTLKVATSLSSAAFDPAGYLSAIAYCAKKRRSRSGCTVFGVQGRYVYRNVSAQAAGSTDTCKFSQPPIKQWDTKVDSRFSSSILIMMKSKNNITSKYARFM